MPPQSFALSNRVRRNGNHRPVGVRRADVAAANVIILKRRAGRAVPFPRGWPKAEPEFDWAEPAKKHARASQYPRGSGRNRGQPLAPSACHRSLPDTSAFFNDLHRLVIARKNTISTMYFFRPRGRRPLPLRLPEGTLGDTRSQVAPNDSNTKCGHRRRHPRRFRQPRLEPTASPSAARTCKLFRPASVRLLFRHAVHFGLRPKSLRTRPLQTMSKGRGQPRNLHSGIIRRR